MWDGLKLRNAAVPLDDKKVIYLARVGWRISCCMAVVQRPKESRPE